MPDLIKGYVKAYDAEEDDGGIFVAGCEGLLNFQSTQQTLVGMLSTDRPLHEAGRWRETTAADLDASRRAHLVVLPKVPLIDIGDVLAMLRGSLD